MSNQQPPTFLLVLFPFFFAGMWLLVSALLAEFSGWSSLARRYPGGPRPDGQRIHGAVMGMGAVGENNVTVMIPTADGLYLYASPLFRFRHPPVMVPWRDIRDGGERGKLWWRNVALELGSEVTIRIRPRAHPALAPYLALAPANRRRDIGSTSASRDHD